MPISDYFPLAGGLAALAGVALTLFITGRREQAKQDRERVDSTRAELRKEAAELLAVVYEFSASADNLGSKIDDGDANEHDLEAHERITLQVRALTMRVRLLTDDPRLVEPVQEVILAHQAVNENIVEKGVRDPTRERFSEAMTGLIKGLYTVAVPTDIIKERRKAVSWLDRRRWSWQERARREQIRAIFKKNEKDRQYFTELTIHATAWTSLAIARRTVAVCVHES